ncbi:MAG: SLBB domain-containing protein [Clostridiales bacterium]
MIKKSILLVLIFTGFLYSQERSGTSTNLTSSSLLSTGISVTVGGSFVVNGTFPASPLERVDQFITRIFATYQTQKLNSQNLPNKNQKENGISPMTVEDYARRNITLKRMNGDLTILDLEKFRQTGDFKNNPYLRNDDILIFPKLDLERNFVSIDGAVNNPVKFQFVDGDKLSDALLFAQGVNKAYEKVNTAEVTRLSYDGLKDETIKIDISSSDFQLQRGDRIRVLADETYKKDYKVLVLGQVNRPGYIYISKENSLLKDVINKAGGFKVNASLSDAEVIRGLDKNELLRKDILTRSLDQNSTSTTSERDLLENRRIDKLSMFRTGRFIENDTTYFKVDDELRQLRGKPLVDFSKLDDLNSEASKFTVKDGDVIVIPEPNPYVYVYGQVADAGYINYEDGKDVNYYLQKAGGVTELAKEFEEINVIKNKSHQWITLKDNKNIKIEPGDYIWVPKETPRTLNYYYDLYMGRVGYIASLVGTIVTIILLTRK